MRINRPTMFLLVLLLPVLGNTPSASNVGTTYTSLEAISAFTVDGLSLDTPYRKMHEALIAKGYTIGSAKRSVEKIESSPRASTRFRRKSNGGFDSRVIDISLANGQVWYIQYNVHSRSFNVSAATADVKKQLGEPTGPCELSTLDKNCRWQNAPDNEYTGYVHYTSREVGSNVSKVHFRISREDIKTAALASLQAAAKPKPAKQKKPTPTPAPVAKKKTKQTADPFVRAKHGKTFGPDVVGLQLGMTIEAAEKNIKNRKTVRKVLDGTPPRPFSRARLFVLEPGDEGVVLLTIKDEHGERVAALLRHVYFDPEDHASVTALASSLDKKYGKPTQGSESERGLRRHWLSDSTGSHFEKLGGHSRPCETVMEVGTDVWKVNGQYYNWQLPWPNNVWGGKAQTLKIAYSIKPKLEEVGRCGPAVWVIYAVNKGQRVGPKLDIMLYDSAWILATEVEMDAKDSAKGAANLDL